MGGEICLSCARELRRMAKRWDYLLEACTGPFRPITLANLNRTERALHAAGVDLRPKGRRVKNGSLYL